MARTKTGGADLRPSEWTEQFARDSGSWRWLEDQIRNREDLPAALRQATLAAIPILSRELGDTFPAEAILSRHPFGREWFANRALLVREGIVRVAHALDQVSGLEGFDSLRDRVLIPEHALSTLFELELACRAMDRGLAAELEPPGPPGRKCDLGVASSEGLRLYLEAVTIPSEAKELERSNEIFHRAVPTLDILVADMVGGSKFDKLPDDDDLEGLYAATDPFWQAHLADHTPGDLRVPGLLTAWIAPRGDEAAKSRYQTPGFPTECNGPFTPQDPMNRIRLRIWDKQGQLPTDQAGVIVVQPPPLSFLGLFGLDNLAAAFAKMIEPFPVVSALVLICDAWGPNALEQSKTLAGGHCFSARRRDQGSMREVLLIWNQARAFPDVDPVVGILFTEG